MSVTNVSFSTEIGTLCFDILPGKARRRETTGGTGGGRKSRKRKREKRAAERNDGFSTMESEDSVLSVTAISREPATMLSGYSSDTADTSDQVNGKDETNNNIKKEQREKVDFVIPSHELRGSRDQAMHGGQFLHSDQSGRHRKVTAGSGSLQHCKVTAGSKQEK